jgi:hypothetical protein
MTERTPRTLIKPMVWSSTLTVCPAEACLFLDVRSLTFTLNCVAVFLEPTGPSSICTERVRLSNNDRAFSFPRNALCRNCIDCLAEIHATGHSGNSLVFLALYRYQLSITLSNTRQSIQAMCV